MPPIATVKALHRQAAVDWEKATISNAFVFNRVMTARPLLLQTLQRVRPDLGITQISQPTSELSLKHAPKSRGYRLDVFARDNQGREFDVEMQVVNQHNLMERSLNYLATMIEEQMEVSDKYQKLKPVHIIFLTKFDPLGKGRQYDYQEFISPLDFQRPIDPPLVSFTFVDVTNDQPATPAPLRRLCNFINDGTVAEADPFILKLKKREAFVKKSAEWRDTFMRIDYDQKFQEWEKQQEIQRARAEEHEEVLTETIVTAAKNLTAQGEDKTTIISQLMILFNLTTHQAEDYYATAMTPA